MDRLHLRSSNLVHLRRSAFPFFPVFTRVSLLRHNIGLTARKIIPRSFGLFGSPDDLSLFYGTQALTLAFLFGSENPPGIPKVGFSLIPFRTGFAIMMPLIMLNLFKISSGKAVKCQLLRKCLQEVKRFGIGP